MRRGSDKYTRSPFDTRTNQLRKLALGVVRVRLTGTATNLGEEEIDTKGCVGVLKGLGDGCWER